MICGLMRYLISRSADRGQEPPGLVRNHVDRCPACRQFQHGLADLGRRLAQDAAALVQPVCGDLHERIVRAIETAKTGDGPLNCPALRPAPLVFPRRAWAYGGLAAAAVLLIVSLLYLNWHSTPQAPPPPVTAVPPKPAAANDIFTLNEIIEAPSWVVSQVTAPIHEEVAGLAEQGKRAAGFVLKQAVMYIEPDSVSLFNGDTTQSKG